MRLGNRASKQLFREASAIRSTIFSIFSRYFPFFLDRNESAEESSSPHLRIGALSELLDISAKSLLKRRGSRPKACRRGENAGTKKMRDPLATRDVFCNHCISVFKYSRGGVSQPKGRAIRLTLRCKSIWWRDCRVRCRNGLQWKFPREEEARCRSRTWNVPCSTYFLPSCFPLFRTPKDGEWNGTATAELNDSLSKIE